MEHREDIEQLFKSTFDNFESEVHPDAWMNIQNALNIPPAPGAGSVVNNTSAGAKVAAVSSKYIIMAVTAIVGLTASVIYFSPADEAAENTPANEIKTVENALPVAAPAETENKIFSDAVNNRKETQEGTSDVKAADKAKATAAETQNSSYLSSTDESVTAPEVNIKSAAAQPDEKNKEVVNQQQNNTIQTPPVVSDEEQKANSDASESLASEPAEDQSVNTSPAQKEEKTIEEYLDITNWISPNGDGKNDAFVIEGKDLTALKVSIIDRSGKIIHEWNNLHGFWDGRLKNGDLAPSGVYIYNIFAQTKSGKPLTKTGSLHLLLK